MMKAEVLHNKLDSSLPCVVLAWFSQVVLKASSLVSLNSNGINDHFRKLAKTFLVALRASRSTPTRPWPWEPPSRVVSSPVTSQMFSCSTLHLFLWASKPSAVCSPSSLEGTRPSPPRRARCVENFNSQLSSCKSRRWLLKPLFCKLSLSSPSHSAGCRKILNLFSQKTLR